MKLFSVKLLALALSLGFAGCGSDTGEENPIVGPCIHEYKEPILNIDTVVGQPGGTELAEVSLAAITINGHEHSLIHTCFGGSVAPTQTAIESSTCKNIRRENSKLICTLPCGFGTETGEWKFTLAATGFTETQKVVNASYQQFAGGCPSYNDKGSRVTFELQEEIVGEAAARFIITLANVEALAAAEMALAQANFSGVERLSSQQILITEGGLVQLNQALAGISVISVQEDETSAAH